MFSLHVSLVNADTQGLLSRGGRVFGGAEAISFFSPRIRLGSCLDDPRGRAGPSQHLIPLGPSTFFVSQPKSWGGCSRCLLRAVIFDGKCRIPPHLGRLMNLPSPLRSLPGVQIQTQKVGSRPDIGGRTMGQWGP